MFPITIFILPLSLTHDSNWDILCEKTVVTANVLCNWIFFKNGKRKTQPHCTVLNAQPKLMKRMHHAELLGSSRCWRVFNRSFDLEDRQWWIHGLWSNMRNSRWVKIYHLVFSYWCEINGPEDVVRDVPGRLGSSSLKWWKMLEK